MGDGLEQPGCVIITANIDITVIKRHGCRGTAMLFELQSGRWGLCTGEFEDYRVIILQPAIMAWYFTSALHVGPAKRQISKVDP